MEEMIKGVGFILLMWMIISAGMIEVAGNTGILWGAVITGVVILSVYIYSRGQK